MVIYKLDDISKIHVGGDTPNQISKIQNKNNKYPILGNGINKKSILGYSQKWKIVKNNITISTRGTIGHVRWINQNFTPCVRLITIFPNEKIVLKKFLFYKLLKIIFPFTGAVQKQLTKPMVKKIKINIPLIKTQKEIIDIIEPNENLFLNYSNCVRIDSIENTKKDIKKLIDIIEPLNKMENLVNKIQNNLNIFFKNVPLKNEKIQFYKIGIQIKNKKLNLNQLSAKIMQKRNPLINKIELVNTYKTNLFFTPRKTLLINTIRPYLEKFSISPIDCDSNGTLFAFQVNKKFESLLLANIMKDNFWKKIVKLQQGTKMPIIKKKDILNLPLKKTSYEINEIFNLIINLNNIIFKIKQIKQKIINILIK